MPAREYSATTSVRGLGSTAATPFTRSRILCDRPPASVRPLLAQLVSGGTPAPCAMRRSAAPDVIRLPTCRSEEAGERSDPAPERRHVPNGKAPLAAQRQASVIKCYLCSILNLTR